MRKLTPIFATILGILLVLTNAHAASISNTVTNPPATNASTAVNVTTSATVNQVLTLALGDTVAAASGGVGCVGITNNSVLATAVGAAGTSALGTFDVAFSSGAPTGAQGCPTPTAGAAVQTFALTYTTPRAARVDATLTGGSTWSSVRAGNGNTLDWTSDATGTNLTAVAATIVPLTAGAGKFNANVQVAWRVAIGAASGAKTGQVTFTLFAP